MQHMLTATRKYQFMEANMQRRAAGLKDKMPDIQKTLETVQFLKTRKVRDYCDIEVLKLNVPNSLAQTQ